MTTTITTTTAPKRRTATTVGLWVLQVALASQFAGAGWMKLSGDPVMLDLFADIGAGQWLRYAVGLLELAGALGLVLPRVCGPAATGLVLLMTGAVLTNVVLIGENPLLPFAFGVVAALIAWLRRAEIRALVSTRALR